MTSAQWIPRSRGSRIRLVTLGLGLLLSAGPAAQLGASTDNGGTTAISIAALVVLLAVLLTTAVVRRQLSIWEGPATAVLTVLVGIGLGNPLNVLPVCVGVIIAQSMYGGWLSELMRLVAFLPVLPVTVALSVSWVSDGITWHSPAVLSVVPPLLVYAALVHMLKGALESQAEAKRRVRFMAGLTADLLGSDATDQAAPVLVSAAAEICRISPGLVMISIRRDPRETPGQASTPGVVQTLFGAEPERPLVEIPVEVLSRLPPLAPGSLREVHGIGRPMASLGLLGGFRWFARGDTRSLDGFAANLVLFGVPRSVSDRLFGIPGTRSAELVDVLDDVSNQRRVAFFSLLEKQALLATAGRDDVTGLTRRRGFLEQLERQADTGEAALILVGLDGIVSLAEQDGLASAAMVTSRTARRLIEVVGDRGSTGRFSDARFAVAVPLPGPPDGPNGPDRPAEVTGPDEVAGLVQELRRGLSGPIDLNGRPFSLSISIGVARTGNGTTAWESVENAATAMRLDRQSTDQQLAKPL